MTAAATSTGPSRRLGSSLSARAWARRRATGTACAGLASRATARAGASAHRSGVVRTLPLRELEPRGAPAGATAVTLNLTPTEPDGPGFLTAYPCDALRPEASNVKYVAGQNVPNLSTVKLAADG